MNRGVFITGTDTNVGKTLISSLLLAALEKKLYFKPIQTGTESDSENVAGLTGATLIEPVYSLKKPMSPDRAAKDENMTIDLEKIKEKWKSVKEFCVVEGAGGIMVPLNNKEKMRDLAQALNLPVLIVARTQLGTINHTLMTIECAKSIGLEVLGVILNGPTDPGLEKVISEQSSVPVLAHIPPLEKVTRETIANFGREFFTPPVLDKILGLCR